MVHCKELYSRKLFTGFSILSAVLGVAILLLVLIYAFPSIKDNQNIVIEFMPEISEDSEYPVYRVSHLQSSTGKLEADVKLEAPGKERNGKNYEELKVEIVFIDRDVVRVTIRDSHKANWHIDEYENNPKYMNNDYEVNLINYPFSIEVINKKSKKCVFNSTATNFYFSDRYLELQTWVDKELIRLGAVREKDNLVLGNKAYSFWSSDLNPAVHPFVLELGEGWSSGFLLHNYNALEIELRNNTLTYRTAGGVLDFFIVLGRSGEEVVRNLHRVQGFPKLPRFSSLGHSYGSPSVKTADDLSDLITFFKDNSIPLDSVWLLDTALAALSSSNISSLSLPANLSISVELSSEIVKDSQLYETLSPVLLEYETDKNAYIDWFQPNSSGYWAEVLDLVDSFRSFGGVSLINNQVNTQQLSSPVALPFIPQNLCLECGSIQLDCLHNNSFTELDLHSLWGDMQVKSTSAWFNKKAARPWIISASTRSGTPASHLIDQESISWSSLRYTLSSNLNYDLVGVRSGSNPCGLKANDKNLGDLCLTWHSVSAFMPVFANFKEDRIGNVRLFIKDNLQTVISVIERRYSLSLLLYSLHFEASLHGGTVIKSPMLEFSDSNLRDFIHQVMMGQALIAIFPVERAESTKFYLPNGKWYDLETGKYKRSREIIVDAVPLKGLVFIRGGHIVPVVNAKGASNLLQVRSRGMVLVIALSESYQAAGSFYVDDGESEDSLEKKKFTKVLVKAQVKDSLEIGVESIVKGYLEQFRLIQGFKVFGCPPPVSVFINEAKTAFTYNDEVLVLVTELFTYSDIRVNINFK